MPDLGVTVFSAGLFKEARKEKFSLLKIGAWKLN